MTKELIHDRRCSRQSAVLARSVQSRNDDEAAASRANESNVLRWRELAHILPSTFPIDALPLHSAIPAGSRVLDYGCGCGRLTPHLLAREPSELVCADIAPSACEIIRSSYPRIELNVIRDASRPSLGRETYDAIVVVGVLSSIIPRAARAQMMSALWDALRCNGSMIVADFGRSNQEYYLRRYESARSEPFTITTDEGLHIHHFARSELCELLPEAHAIESRLSVTARTVHGNTIPGHIVVGRRRNSG